MNAVASVDLSKARLERARGIADLYLDPNVAIIKQRIPRRLPNQPAIQSGPSLSRWVDVAPRRSSRIAAQHLARNQPLHPNATRDQPPPVSPPPSNNPGNNSPARNHSPTHRSPPAPNNPEQPISPRRQEGLPVNVPPAVTYKSAEEYWWIKLRLQVFNVSRNNPDEHRA